MATTAADDTAVAPLFETLGLYGVPVTCVLWLDSGRLVWGQGNWLHHCTCFAGSPRPVTSKLRVLDRTTLHGMTSCVVHDTKDDILLLHGGNELAVVSLHDDNSKMVVQARHTMNDWIWTCATTSDTTTTTVYVGMAHGMVAVFAVELFALRHVVTHTAPRRSITYSMDLLPTTTSTSCWVACGTVTNTVEVWNIQNESHHSHHQLVGHKGAIHDVGWATPTLLASIGDDRAVIVWHYNKNSNRWTKRWTGWEHTARGWRVAFASGEMLCSTGEDGTLLVWNVATGALLRTFRGGAKKQSVWAVDCCKNNLMVVTGANDGSIATHDIGSVDFDRTIDLPSANSTTKYTVFDMQMVPARNSDADTSSGPALVVGYRDGSLHSLDSDTKTWTTLQPWRDDYHCAADEPSCLAVHPTRPVVVVGLKSGKAIVRFSDAAGVELDGTVYRSVQKLQWLQHDVLVSYHAMPGTVVLWTLSFDGELKVKRLLKSDTNGLSLCCANDSTGRCVVGDSRGHVSLHHDTEHYVLRRVHGREHVTQILWDGDSTVLSAGNDGCIARCAVTAANELIPLVSIPVTGITGITHVWRRSSGMTLIGGYHGNRFRVVDRDSGYEHSSFETGGRQRLLTAYCCDVTTRCVIAVRPAAGACVRVVDTGEELTRTMVPRAIIQPMQSETIFDITSFFAAGNLYVVSGSEDCSAKISCFHDPFGAVCGNITATTLPPQTSGIRSVCSLRLPYNDVTLVVVASKIELQFYLMQHDEASSSNIFYQGSAVPSQKGSIDQRANCLAASVLPNEEGVFVAVGGSDGICYLTTLVPTWGVVKRARLYPVYQCDRPILALGIVTVEDQLLVALGSSGGDAALIGIRPELHGEATEESVSVLLRYTPHVMGLNGISVRILPSPQQTELHILSCGDDQTIYVARIVLDNSQSQLHAHLESGTSAICASRSALRGLRPVGNNHFVTVGYAGRITLWSYHNESIDQVRELSVCVGDVNCLSCTAVHGAEVTRYLLAVGGAGVELILLQN